MRVLLVEDETIVALGLKVELESSGYTVLGPAVSAAEAMEIADETKPDVALVNITLQGESDGVALARLLHERHGVKCVFVTAQPSRAQAGRDFALGYIVKPYSLHVIGDCMKAIGRFLDDGIIRDMPTSLKLFAAA